jgi:hypothetical protein
MYALAGIVQCIVCICFLCLLSPNLKREEHREPSRLCLTRIASKLPRFIIFLLGDAMLCLTVQADQSPNLSTNLPENNRRELLAPSSISFGYTGAAQKW